MIKYNQHKIKSQKGLGIKHKPVKVKGSDPIVGATNAILGTAIVVSTANALKSI